MRLMSSVAVRRKAFAATAVLLLGLGTTLQWSGAPSEAGSIGPAPGVVVVNYGRTSPTDLEAAWSSRGVVSVQRTSRGNYSITAPNVTGTGNSQITVLGPGAPLPMCNVVSTSNANPGTKLKVRCWSATTGKTVDAGFSLMFTSYRVADPSNHYLVLTTNKASKSHVPNNQFNAVDATARATVTRLGKGSYKVTYPVSLRPSNGGILFVSATGNAARYCNLGGWDSLDDLGGIEARVDCFSRTGAKADSLFTLTASQGDVAGGSSESQTMSAWRDRDAFGNEYTDLGTNYHWNGSSGTDRSRNEFQLGRSTVVGDNLLFMLPTRPTTERFPNPYLSFVMVTGYGWNPWPEVPGHEATNLRCAPGAAQLDFVARDATFEVQCYDPSGYPVNASYIIGAVLINLVA